MKPALAARLAHSALVAPAAHTARRVALALGRSDVGVAALPASVAAREPADGPPRLLFLGRFEPIKGPDLLLDAVGRLPGGLLGEVTLAGGGSLEGALRERSQGLGTPVRFAGVVTGAHKEDTLASAHALVLPSRRLRDGRAEGLPHAAIESLAAGRPIVAPREGALADLVEASGAGVLYDATRDDEGRVRALARALRDLAARPERLRALCARARAAGDALRAARPHHAWHELLAASAGAPA
jgi:glycosyltransferase involved in cell wall biosynthesis